MDDDVFCEDIEQSNNDQVVPVERQTVSMPVPTTSRSVQRESRDSGFLSENSPGHFQEGERTLFTGSPEDAQLIEHMQTADKEESCKESGLTSGRESPALCSPADSHAIASQPVPIPTSMFSRVGMASGDYQCTVVSSTSWSPGVPNLPIFTPRFASTPPQQQQRPAQQLSLQHRRPEQSPSNSGPVLFSLDSSADIRQISHYPPYLSVSATPPQGKRKIFNNFI